MLEKPSIPVAVKFIGGLLPEAHWLLRHAEKEAGWIRFPPRFIQVLANLRLEGYVQLYEDERQMAACVLIGMFGETEARGIVERIARQSGNEILRSMDEIAAEFGNTAAGCLTLPKSKLEIEAVRAAFDALPAVDKEQVIRDAQFFYSGLLASFFQTISIMVHGEKLTALVAQAKGGSSEAFGKAVQIDRTLVTQFRWFRDRYQRAHLEGDAGFLEMLSYRLRNPVFKGKIRYRELWLALAMLDMMGLLDGPLKFRELIDMLHAAGLDLARNGIEDEGYFGKRLKEFRKFQARGGLSMH